MTEGFKQEEAYHKVGRLEANRPSCLDAGAVPEDGGSDYLSTYPLTCCTPFGLLTIWRCRTAETGAHQPIALSDCTDGRRKPTNPVSPA